MNYTSLLHCPEEMCGHPQGQGWSAASEGNVKNDVLCVFNNQRRVGGINSFKTHVSIRLITLSPFSSTLFFNASNDRKIFLLFFVNASCELNSVFPPF